MTDVEQWEPTSTGEALATLDSLALAVDQAVTVEQVQEVRTMAEIAIAYVRRHDESHAIILQAQEVMRNAERKLALLMNELKAAGKVRGSGRPKKQPVNGIQDSDEQPVNDIQVSVRDVFGDPMSQRDAGIFATINEDDWEEALAAGREKGDLSRKALARLLRTPREERTARPDNGDIPTVARVVPKAIKALTGVADALETFDPEGVEHEDRKEWKTELRTQIDRVMAWQKGLPR